MRYCFKISSLTQQLNEKDQMIGEFQRKIKQYRFESQEQEHRSNVLQAQLDDSRTSLNLNQSSAVATGDDVPFLKLLMQQMDEFIFSNMSVENLIQTVKTNTNMHGNQFESFGRLTEDGTLKDFRKRGGSHRLSSRMASSTNTNQIAEKFNGLLELIYFLTNAQNEFIDQITRRLLQKQIVVSSEDQNILEDFLQDFEAFKNTPQGLKSYAEQFSTFKRVLVDVISRSRHSEQRQQHQHNDSKGANSRSRNQLQRTVENNSNNQGYSQFSKGTLKKQNDTADNSSFSNYQVGYMARYIQSLHQLGQNYIESVVRGDRPIAERLEVIIRKYKSLKPSPFYKRIITLVSAACNVVVKVFRLWKEHVINVSEILFELGEAARIITTPEEEDSISLSYHEFEQKVAKSMRLIETDTFANAIDKYLVDIESSADKSQNLTLETDT